MVVGALQDVPYLVASIFPLYRFKGGLAAGGLEGWMQALYGLVCAAVSLITSLNLAETKV